MTSLGLVHRPDPLWGWHMRMSPAHLDQAPYHLSPMHSDPQPSPTYLDQSYSQTIQTTQFRILAVGEKKLMLTLLPCQQIMRPTGRPTGQTTALQANWPAGWGLSVPGLKSFVIKKKNPFQN